MTAPVEREHDNEAVGGDDEEEDEMEISDKDLESVSKVHTLSFILISGSTSLLLAATYRSGSSLKPTASQTVVRRGQAIT